MGGKLPTCCEELLGVGFVHRSASAVGAAGATCHDVS